MYHTSTASPVGYSEIVELYPYAEENPAVSRVFFRETAIFRNIGPPRPPRHRPADDGPSARRPVRQTAGRDPLGGETGGRVGG